ncbi:malate permease [Pandoraea apista]|uniref:Malate permease n=2 Tax=Pandoraea apista TaxID=93218 RepID=A0ABX9ZVE8_9BURK|nr:2-hydroxycarboxylate transporter family protein [Pandoraea apista]PTE02003.1 malate permease [Pandoraea apista]RRJ32463.1 malate permease [Pandoraea apista]RRJ81881.1 malate permease [Pandoraea apista]RSD11149.1 malate permease [Pandoraea apista]RSD24294.1 malate permease [Pandoraea apista]
MDMRVGIVPLPVHLVLIAAIVTTVLTTGKLSAELSPIIALLAVCSFTCMEIGQRIPIFRSIGGPVILVTFLPSWLVFTHALPPSVVTPIVAFWKQSNFLYLFIPGIIVGSILSMDRKVLIGGFLRIFVPLAIGSVLAGIVGTAVGTLLGMGLFHTVFFVVVPVMSGGLGEGVIPLTLGYAEVLHESAGDLLAQALPAVMLGNVCAIVFSGVLNAIGKRYPSLTGNGQLMRSGIDDLGTQDSHDETAKPALPVDATDIAAAGMIAVCLYFVGMLAQNTLGLPGPVMMLVFAVAAKIGFIFSPKIEAGAGVVYKFFATAVTYPLLFAIGVVITPWQKVVASFNVPTLVTIVATVLTLMVTAFVVARRMNMHPIDAAIVVGTHSGMGGTGDVAILTAANRMRLMPFAQIATRIGGAITITLSLIVLAKIV